MSDCMRLFHDSSDIKVSVNHDDEESPGEHHNSYKNSIHVSANQFKIFRLLFGLYLTHHFISLSSYSTILFGSGMIADPYMNPTWETWSSLVPNVLIPVTDIAMHNFVNMMAMCSVFFTIGILQNMNAFFLWFGWASLFNRNNFIGNPGLPYVGWLLLACTIIPNPGLLWEDFFVQTKHSKTWKMPTLIFWSAWFLMALGYTISGIDKLQCQSWLDGSALHHVLDGVLARDNVIADMTLHLIKEYAWLNKFMTWSSLFLEISFLFFGLFDRLRFWYWIAYMTMHISILMLINFTDLTLGVMMIHLFTFDHRWISMYGKYLKS